MRIGAYEERLKWDFEIGHTLEDYQGAVCAQADPDAWFPDSSYTADNKRALAMCTDCPIRLACLQGAVERREEFGTWGGHTQTALRELFRSPVEGPCLPPLWGVTSLETASPATNGTPDEHHGPHRQAA
jgi:hypothetical protein